MGEHLQSSQPALARRWQATNAPAHVAVQCAFAQLVGCTARAAECRRHRTLSERGHGDKVMSQWARMQGQPFAAQGGAGCPEALCKPQGVQNHNRAAMHAVGARLLANPPSEHVTCVGWCSKRRRGAVNLPQARVLAWLSPAGAWCAP